MKEKMKEERREKREEMNLLKNVSNQKKSARRTSSTCFEKKKASDEFFVRKFRILPVFSIICMIRIRFSGSRECFRMNFGGHTEVFCSRCEGVADLESNDQD